MRYFTRGVRFPRLIGRTPDGTRLWGGPYTTTQAVGGLCALLVLYLTRGLWSGGDLLTAFAVILGGTCVVVYALRYIRTGGRNPVMLAQGLISVCTQPRLGRVDGRPLRPRPRRSLTGRAVPAHSATAATMPAMPVDAVVAHDTASQAPDLPAPRRARTGTTGSAAGQLPAPPGNPQGQLAAAASPVLSNVGRLLAARDPARTASAGPRPAGRAVVE